MPKKTSALVHDLQSYFDSVYPGIYIDMPETLLANSIAAHDHLVRFELSRDLYDFQDERSYEKQAIERALAIFNETFVNVETEIFVLIYCHPDGRRTKSLRDSFPIKYYKHFFDRVIIPMETFTESENELIEYRNATRVVIGKIKIEHINKLKIFRPLAAGAPWYDMYFIDPESNKGFCMRDGSYCFVWSKTANAVQSVQDKFRDWIITSPFRGTHPVKMWSGEGAIPVWHLLHNA